VHEHFHAHEDGMGHAHEHGHGPLVHRFDDAEKWAREFDDPGRDAWQKPDEVVRLLALEPGMVVADLGAGTGYFMARLSRAVGDKGTVYALDVEDDMVRYLAARAKKERLGNVLAMKVGVDEPGLAPGSCDRVLVVDTWHHIPSRSTYVPKLARGLRKGGLLLVVDFTKDAKHGPPPGSPARGREREAGAGASWARGVGRALDPAGAVGGGRTKAITGERMRARDWRCIRPACVVSRHARQSAWLTWSPRGCFSGRDQEDSNFRPPAS
jgi:SAM-dependent methyltransferase